MRFRPFATRPRIYACYLCRLCGWGGEIAFVGIQRAPMNTTCPRCRGLSAEKTCN